MENQNTNTENGIFLSVEEAAELMKSTKKTLYTYLCNSGSKGGKKRSQFPKRIYVKAGRKVLFIKENLLNWIMSGCKFE